MLLLQEELRLAKKLADILGYTYYMNTPTRHNFRLGCAKKFWPAFLMSIISVEEEEAAAVAT